MRIRIALIYLVTLALTLVVASSLQAAPSSQSQSLSLPADSPRWVLEGQAKVMEYQGRQAIYLDGGGATVKDFQMRDGVIDVDVSTPASRGFFGI